MGMGTPRAGRLIIRANKLLYRPLLAALIARLDSHPTKADWAACERELDAMVRTIGEPLFASLRNYSVAE